MDSQLTVEKAIEFALDGDAILFVGSGFSCGAKNSKNEEVKTGKGLARFLAQKCGVTEEYSLEIISSYFEKEFGTSALVSLLKEQYTITSIADFQRNIMSVPWKRIYTTNYDRVIEIASASSGRTLHSLTPDEHINNNQIYDLCIHINGDIEKLSVDTINRSFKLTDAAYSSESLNGKPGYELFKKDIQYSNSIIVIGYSAQYDIDIKRILALSNKKTVFICDKSVDRISSKLIENYGLLDTCGSSGFSSKINSTRLVYKKSSRDIYTSFMHYYRDYNIQTSSDYTDVAELFTLGKVNERCFEKNDSGEYRYLVSREEEKFILNQNLRKRLTVVVSDLGNGKTTFLNMVQKELITSDMHVFCYFRTSEKLDAEINTICSIPDPCLVIIDNYEQCSDILSRFGQLIRSKPNIWFLISSRSRIHERNKYLLLTWLGVSPQDIKTINLNYLSNAGCARLADIFYNEGLLSSKMRIKNIANLKSYVQYDCNAMFSCILLNSFKSAQIYDRMRDMYDAKYNKVSVNVMRLGVFLLLKEYMNISIDYYTVFDMFRIDLFEVTATEYSWIDELFNIKEKSVVSRSSIVSREFLINVIDMSAIIDVLVFVFKESDKRNSDDADSVYRSTMKNVISHSHYIDFLQKPNGINEVLRFYDELRNQAFCIRNPFFWTQYASACIDAGKFEIAKQCLETAFACSYKQYGSDFKPYQTETVYGKYITKLTLNDLHFGKINGDIIINRLLECHERITKYTTEDGNIILYSFDIFRTYALIWDASVSILDARQSSIFLQTVIDAMGRVAKYVPLDDSEKPQIAKIRRTLEKLSEGIRKKVNLSAAK